MKISILDLVISYSFTNVNKVPRSIVSIDPFHPILNITLHYPYHKTLSFSDIVFN